MSIIDLLFNLGEKSETYLKKGINLEDVILKNKSKIILGTVQFGQKYGIYRNNI